jgi:glycerol kinase
MNRYLLAIDQGTTGSTALVMGMDGRTLGRESQELPQHFPESAWVEQDPAEVQSSVTLALRAAGVGAAELPRCGLIGGLTRGSSAGHSARATLEAIALQVTDLVSAMREALAVRRRTADVLSAKLPTAGRSAGSAEGGAEIARIRVDGGAGQNNLLMQFQSDVSNVGIERPFDVESTARGAALFAGVGAGVSRDPQSDPQSAAQWVEHPQRFQLQMTNSEREQRVATWLAAVRRTRSGLGVSALVAAPPRQLAEEGSHAQ